MLMNIFAVLVVLSILNTPFALLAHRVIVNNAKLTNKSISIIDHLVCLVPIYNIYHFRRNLETKAPVIGICVVFIYVSIILRLLAVFIVKDPRFLLVTSCIFIISLVLLWVVPAYCCTVLARDMGKTIYCVASVIAPPIGAFCLYLVIDAFYHNNKEGLDSSFDVEN